VAVFFQLSKKTNPEFTPEKFSDVDTHICAYFGVPVDKHHYYRQWFDIEGFSLAMGKSFDWMRENYPDRLPIIDFLDRYYTSNDWRS